MVRDYKRTTDRGSWSKESMREAVKAVLDGKMGYCKAAKQFGLPQTTLERKVKAARSVLNVTSDENYEYMIKWASGFNKVAVDNFFNFLGNVYDEHQLTPDRIYNCNETEHKRLSMWSRNSCTGIDGDGDEAIHVCEFYQSK